MKSTNGWRTRWAALGAACAVALGAGGFGVVNAVVSTGNRAVYVAVNPVRILDTRNSSKIVDDTRRLVVEGVITVVDGTSYQIVPVDATAVAINITATSTRKNGNYGFVTAYPCTSSSDSPPNASSLNFENGVDIANALNVTTSTNGSICLHVHGTADLIVDIAGYYVDHDHDDRYYTKAQVDTGLASKADNSDLYHPIVASAPNTIDSTGDVGWQTSIAIGTNGNPIISYYDDTNSDLKIAACDNPTCTSTTVRTIDSNGEVGPFTSIAIGTNGNPVISYYDLTNQDLKIAVCDNPTCTTATSRTIDSNGDVGRDTSIAIGTNSYPVISYRDFTNGDLKIAVCGDSTCTTATSRAIDSNGDVGFDTSIAIGTYGNPVISYLGYQTGDLKVAACDDPVCSTFSISVVDSTDYVGIDTSIAIGTNGNPIISYRDFTNGDLKVAVCPNSYCSPLLPLPILSVVDSNGNVGSYSSIVIGANGVPIISYYDLTNGDLKVASAWWLAGGR